MRGRLIVPTALLVAMAGTAAADMPTSADELYNHINLTVQNCMYDGHTHEFVIYRDDTSSAEQEKLDIAHGSSAVMTCKAQKPGTKCQVKVHGSSNEYVATSAITFYANRKVNNFVDANCSREHSAGSGETTTTDDGDNMP